MERLNMTSYREKFQQLLRELFQFDCADLDFGIYRIMNHKRDVVEKFITQDLPKAIADELDRDALADQAQASKELKEVSEQITQTFGKDALDTDGNLAATYHATPLGTKYMTLKTFLSEASEGMVPIDVWHYKLTGTTDDGGNVVKALFGSAVFDNPKPPSLVERALSLSPEDGDSLFVLDHFAGSGTTGHAVINLNRETGGRRRFILVEVGDYFDTVVLPRVKKVTFTPEWKDGKPERMATDEEFDRGPRIVKYIGLESYEDALNNIEFDDASGQQALKFDDYLIKYMLKWETRASETMLNVEKLARPFSFKLHIHGDGQTREKVSDIPETFNYLLGLHVQIRRVYDDDGRRYLVYRGQIDHREIVVIWRETEGWQKADLERDKKFVAEKRLSEGADEVFVNGDSFIPNAKALEPVFKARMFGEVQA